MATEAQILANRANARKSTGPRTPEGKAIVAQNAVKHGLSGTETVITGEDPGEFEFYRERMLAELDPAGEIESTLAERIVSLSWRLKRAERLQAAAFAALYARQKEWLGGKGDQQDEAVLGGALVRDYANYRVLDRLLMYEKRIEHSLYRTMAELKRHRILQEVEPGQMWELRRALAREEDAGTEDHGQDARATGAPAGGCANAPGCSSDQDVGRENHGRDARVTGTLPESACKTKPISSTSDQGQVLCDARVATTLPCRGACETKPICRAGAAFEDTPGGESPACRGQLHNKNVAVAQGGTDELVCPCSSEGVS